MTEFSHFLTVFDRICSFLEEFSHFSLTNASFNHLSQTLLTKAQVL